MRFIFNPSTGNLESTDNVTGPDVTLGDKFKLAQLDNFNTPDLEQSPDSFLRPGETLEDRMLVVDCRDNRLHQRI